MSLHEYCEKRLVVQNSDTLVYDAARALKDNHIGAIVVQDQGRIRGIVTDRDLAVRVIGLELSAKETRLHDIMTPEPVTLTPDDSEEQAILLMRAQHVRRIPIVDGQRVVGIVTLDDLIVSGAAEPRQLANIVEAQLLEPSRAKPPGVIHPTRQSGLDAGGLPKAGRAFRHWARAEQTLIQFTRRLQDIVEIADADRALTAFEIVISGIARRLTATEAQHLASQLPTSFREALLDMPAGPDSSVTRRSIEDEVARQLGLDQSSAAQLVSRIAGSLSEFVSAGELSDVLAQLPADMKELLSAAAQH